MSHIPLVVPTDTKRTSVLFLHLLIQSTATSGKEEDGNYTQSSQDRVFKEVSKEEGEVERADEEGTRHTIVNQSTYKCTVSCYVNIVAISRPIKQFGINIH